MPALLPTLAAGAAGLAFGGAVWQIGTRILDLEKRDQAPPPQASAGRSSRASKAMFSGLYRDPTPSPLSALISIPGGTWLGAALVLGLLAGITSFRRERPPAATVPDSGFVRLQSRLDSLALVVRQLHDSLSLARTPAAPEKAKPTPTRLARRPAPDSKSILPAAPPPPVGSPVQ